MNEQWTHAALRVLGRLHGATIFPRRVEVLVAAIDAVLGESTSVLDVGCGDGSIGAALIAARGGGLSYQAVEVRPRPECRVPVVEFDGRRLPFEDGSFDHVMFVDVLHHAQDPAALLREARRVARRGVVIKDHLRDRPGAALALAAMDWVGNRPHGVKITGKFWSSEEWTRAYAAAGLVPVRRQVRLHLYPALLRPMFEWGLHHLTLLEPAKA